jgi:hypothetical protein
MAKSHRSEPSTRASKPSPDAASFASQNAFRPDPPKRHPWCLALAALAMALWLLFLLWMAIDATSVGVQ